MSLLVFGQKPQDLKLLEEKLLQTNLNITCQKPKIGKKNQFDYLPLFSFGGSGNTWVRHLIEQSTGYCTGSVYNDQSLASNLIAELIDINKKSTIVQKSHNVDGFLRVLPKNIRKSTKIAGCVFIFRNPRDAILAEYNRRSLHDEHAGSVDSRILKKRLTRKYWNETSDLLASKFTYEYRQELKFCLDKAKSKSPYFLIFYEELKKSETNLIITMKNLVNYLNQIYQNQHLEEKEKIIFRESCLRKNLEGNFHRNSSTRDWDVAQFLSEIAIKNINQSLDRLKDKFGISFPEEYWI